MVTVTRTDGDADSSNLTTYTFTSTIGSNGGTDILYVFSGARSASTVTAVSSLTIDGVAATQIASVFASDNGGADGNVLAHFSLPRNSLPSPNNTTVTISVTFNQPCTRAFADMFVGVGSSATAYDTATDSATAENSASETLDLNLDVPAAGIVVAALMAGGFQGTTWVGLTETQDYQFENNRASTALLSAGSEETNRTINATNTFTYAPVAIAASYGAATSSGVGVGLTKGLKLDRAQLIA